MTGRDNGSGPWIFLLKALGFVIALIGMVGFGLCGMLGVSIGLSSGTSDLSILALGILGLLIAVGFLLMIRAILRSGKRKAP